MKNKVVMFGVAAMLASSAVLAQGVENDDMYFTSKDRARLKAQQASEQVVYQSSINKNKRTEAVEEAVNPTDSYSARNENPEFAARSNSQQATADNQDYFVSNYRYNNASNLTNWNNNFNSWYGSSWYRPNYYSSSIYGWNSPYYGSYYDSWGSPWMNPYYSSGFSSSYSMNMGNSWNYGFGTSMGYGMGMGMASCPYMMNPYMNSWASWGSYGYGAYNNYYPSSVVIINNGEYGRNVSYGKRATHGGMVTTRQQDLNSRTRPIRTDADPSVGVKTPGNYGGRTSSTAVTTGRVSRQEDYYNRGWRNAQQTGSYSAPTRSSTNGWNRSSSSDSYNNHQNSFSNPSNNNSNSGRSSSFESGGTRSSAPASSGSNGRTRGRD